MTILVTGGCGFIGSNFILDSIELVDEKIINIDKLTYAGNLQNLVSIVKSSNYHFIHGDLCNFDLLKKIIYENKPRVIINFAAETHVDRSINSPENFIQTNIIGTYRLLEACRIYWNELDNKKKSEFRLLHISTDEIYGSLKNNDSPFRETNKLEPNSPYSASKAASDHLVRAWYKTYELPTITTNCSNNYGPYQFPEKLIPLTIVHALEGKKIPIYGDGKQVRDWLFVKDHCNAIRKIIELGKVGEVYNIGGENEKSNIEIVTTICNLLDEMNPASSGVSYRKNISFVADRPGHDRRYAVDVNKIKTELNWKPSETFKTGLEKTIKWYLDNLSWVKSVQNNEHIDWIKKQYGLNK